MNEQIIELGPVSYLPEIQAIIAQSPSADAIADAEDPITVGKWRIAPWGEDNNLPANVMEKIGNSDPLSANIDHNIKMMYGQGVQPYLRFVEDGKERFEICTDERVLQFYEENDIPGYFLEQCADMATFYMAVPEFILTRDLKSVYSLRHKEAAFSRWGVVDKKTGQIIKHYYSSEWDEGGANDTNTVESEVLNRVNPLGDLRNRIAKRGYVHPRFMMNIAFPTPGRTYYPRPSYYSIFNSGSYDFSTMIWNFKKALLKNGLVVKYIIYISDKYWDLIFMEEKIDKNNPEKVKARKELEFEKWRNFLGNEENAGKGMMVLKKMIPSGNSAVEEKYITIEPVKTEKTGGELLEDSSEVANTINYATGVHPSLIGSPPGKNNNSMSGTDKRELYHIKSAMMAPFRDRLLRPLYLVKAFNNFPANLVWKVVDYNFTTLDKNKSGKEEGSTSANPPINN
jgi:hypothetical protein